MNAASLAHLFFLVLIRYTTFSFVYVLLENHDYILNVIVASVISCTVECDKITDIATGCGIRSEVDRKATNCTN
jgi:hypothetical protein